MWSLILAIVDICLINITIKYLSWLQMLSLNSFEVSYLSQPLAIGKHWSALYHLGLWLISLGSLFMLVHVPIVCSFLLLNLFHSKDMLHFLYVPVEWHLYCFLSLVIYNSAMNSHVHELSWHMCSFVLGKYLWWEILGYKVNIYLTV